jgi:hypothetical protein
MSRPGAMNSWLNHYRADCFHHYKESYTNNIMLGKGAYDGEHDIVHKLTGATSSILIVLDGKTGHGMSCKITEKHLKMMPDLLRKVADLIGPELIQDIKQIEAIKKGDKPHEDGADSFPG